MRKKALITVFALLCFVATYGTTAIRDNTLIVQTPTIIPLIREAIPEMGSFIARKIVLLYEWNTEWAKCLLEEPEPVLRVFTRARAP